MVWAHRYEAGEAFYKITCNCGCNETIDFWLCKDEECQDWSVRISSTTRYIVWSEYHKWRVIKFLLNVKKRLAIAWKILYTGEVRTSSEVIIGEANIDDFVQVVLECKEDLHKQNMLK